MEKTKRVLHFTDTPGIQAMGACVTDNCRQIHGSTQAAEIACERLIKSYKDMVEGREKNGCGDHTDYHFVLTVDDQRFEADPEKVSVRASIGGVRRAVTDLNADEARVVRKAAEQLVKELTDEFNLGND